MKNLLIAALVALALPATASADWPTWGNIEHGDCAFAAAANWELLHGGTSATEESILAEYLTADPGEEGLSGEQLETIWRTKGIGGRRVSVHSLSRGALAPAFRRHGPLVVQLMVMPGQRWRRVGGASEPGDTTSSVVDSEGGIHFAVVRYVTRRGPVLLSWGELGQLTWWQWREDAVVLYVPA